MTQLQRIISYLDEVYPAWKPGYELSKIQTAWGWISNRGERDCRELAEQGKLERKYEGPKNYVYYRVKKEPVQLSLV